jgi:hypothetical protein
MEAVCSCETSGCLHSVTPKRTALIGEQYCLEIIVAWDVMPCNLVDGDERFG